MIRLLPYQFGAFILVFLLIACGDNESPENDDLLLKTTPEDIGDGLQVDIPSNVGMDISLLGELENAVRSGEYKNIHSILIAKNSRLIFESYFPGTTVFGEYIEWDRDQLHNIHSATKSVTSALVGIALEQNDLTAEEQIFSYFPEFNIDEDDPKMSITVGDVLSMSSGLQWDEWSLPYENPGNDHQQMYDHGNWVEFVAIQPLDVEPGSVFIYNSGLSILLGAFVTKLSGISVRNFASQNLFQPMGIFDNKTNWFRNHLNTYQTGGGLQMTPRGMMKFGLLFQNDGNWNGKQIISPDWITTSTSQQGPNSGYAYHWWLTTYDTTRGTMKAFLAAGRGGQYVIVIDQLDLTVVFTGGNDNSLATAQPREIMLKYILPSALSQ